MIPPIVLTLSLFSPLFMENIPRTPAKSTTPLPLKPYKLRIDLKKRFMVRRMRQPDFTLLPLPRGARAEEEGTVEDACDSESM